MRSTLKQFTRNQVTLHDGSRFYYIISAYELRNVLGQEIALLDQYEFSQLNDSDAEVVCKLFRTKEGNWYDVENALGADKTLIRQLKLALDGTGDQSVLIAESA